jgi:ADP-ribose pyrophosphatase YjhB (NUDIX family)
MSASNLPRWLEWARQIQALGQTGIAFSQTDYDLERYQRLMEIAARIVQGYTQLPKQVVLDSFQIQPGYATPKVDVRGAVTRNGKVLLVQERSDKLWCLPGGWADVGETPSATVVREVHEESGFEIVARKVIGVYDANRGGVPLELYHAYKVVFLCDLVGGEPRPSYETLAVEFFGFDELPPLSTMRTSERHLKDLLAHIQDPGCPTFFD